MQNNKVSWLSKSGLAAVASIFIVNPAYSSCTSTEFVDYHSEKDGYGHYLSANLDKYDSGNSVLIFGNKSYSEFYYFKANGMVYKVKTCGYKCSPRDSIVTVLPAKGKCKIAKLNSKKFDVHCIAVDAKGEKHTNGLNNTIRENKGYPCYDNK